MSKKAQIILFSALGVLFLFLIGTSIWVAVKRKRQKQEESTEPMLNTSTSRGDIIVEKMQAYLLNLGMTHNNNVIIDAIRLTGGVDGIAGAGFETALAEAIDKGFVQSLSDLRNRVSNN